MREFEVAYGLTVLVDDADYPDLSRFVWRLDSRYAAAAGRDEENKPITLRMHRYVMNAPKGTEVDHLNGDTLDNRRKNLWTGTRLDNGRNKPKHRMGQGRFVTLYEVRHWSGFEYARLYAMLDAGVIPNRLPSRFPYLIPREEMTPDRYDLIRWEADRVAPIIRPRCCRECGSTDLTPKWDMWNKCGTCGDWTPSEVGRPAPPRPAPGRRKLMPLVYRFRQRMRLPGCLQEGVTEFWLCDVCIEVLQHATPAADSCILWEELGETKEMLHCPTCGNEARAG